ncbi:MAG TPA: hypothetical protein VG476_12520, partial [Acidimicrobiales bacterium]|nr:hypothetical protein [Acidimicrobiales bacterium]
GPLGAIRVLGPRLHQALDLVLVVGLVLSPIVARSNLDVAGVIVAEALAVVLLRLAFRTRYVPAPVPETPAVAPATAVGGSGAAAEHAENAPAETGHEPAPEPAAQPEGARPVPSTAWTLGVLAARARRRGAGPDRLLCDGARRLGSAVARTNRRRGD